ncbi:MAG: PDGLE domain-containing protein [Candidatus Margulisiibacteriota bacterium]
MKKLFWVSVVIAILAAFFASANPDGLDFISEKLGFAEKGQERTAPLADYSVGFLPAGGISTSTAGIAGILITLGIFWLAAYALKRGDNKTKNKAACSLFLILAAVSPVFAARPLVTDDFYTVAAGGYELEVGYAATQNQASQANGANLSFKRGILANFDLGIEVPYAVSSPSGLNDILLHAKYRLWERGEDEGLTGRIDYKFNNGDVSQGLGSGDNDYCLMLIYSKMVGSTKTHWNFGHVKVGINGGVQSADYFAYSIALEQPVWGENGDVVAEYVANNAASPSPAFIQLGARYLVAQGLKLDAGYSVGLNNNTIKNSATAGIHYEF